MITSNGKHDTDGAEPVTLIDEAFNRAGTLSVWTFDPASGAGKLIINGAEVIVDAGEFSLQHPLDGDGHVIVQIQRTGDTDMAGWQAVFG